MRAYAALLIPIFLLWRASSAFTVSLPLQHEATTRICTFCSAIEHKVADGISSFELANNHDTALYQPTGPVDAVLHQPAVWSTFIMIVIVTLLYVWETTVETLREETPKTFLPVIESVLGEIGGLGFIGLLLEMSLQPLGGTIEHLSEKYLGEGELLLETFENLHTAFFQVGVGFFLVAGTIVAKVLKNLVQMRTLSSFALDESGQCSVTKETLAEILNPPILNCQSFEEKAAEIVKERQATALQRELFLNNEMRGAQAMVGRERWLQQLGISDDFRVEFYLEYVFAHNLKEIVELTPLVWLPWIPSIAVANALDLSREVVNAASSNALESTGFFFSDPLMLFTTVTAQSFGVGWCLYNTWKISQVKQMVIPNFVIDAATKEPTVLPPLMDYPKAVEAFQSTPALLGPLESFCGQPAKTVQERLFGGLGGNGEHFLLSSIKYHTWLTVCSIVFFSTQILSRDYNAIFNGLQVGDPDHLLAESTLFTTYVVSSGIQLAIAPTTFLNYCVVTSVEDMTKQWAIEKASEGVAKDTVFGLISNNESGSMDSQVEMDAT